MTGASAKTPFTVFVGEDEPQPRMNVVNKEHNASAILFFIGFLLFGDLKEHSGGALFNIAKWPCDDLRAAATTFTPP